MCGIVAYIGKKKARPILIEGLKRLEYRGYDSAGVALIEKNAISIVKSKGRIAVLEDLIKEKTDTATVGIGHTRWATHGEPNTVNAHPHSDFTGKISLVHNGIIENYSTLKQWLIKEGVAFKSQTDTEVLANLIGYFYAKPSENDSNHSFEKAVQRALDMVVGTYGLAIICDDCPDTIIAAKKGSPLILGVGQNEYIIASDASAIVEHTQQAVYLSDNEMAVVNNSGFYTKTIDDINITKEVKDIEFSLDAIELNGYEHYMLKEIFEQPTALSTCLGGRIDTVNNKIVLGGIANLTRELTRAKKFIITSCGTAWHAGLIGEYLIEQIARIPVEVEYASELRYRNPIIEDGTFVIAISQSGETADTLAAIEMCKERGAVVMGAVNVVGSTIARTTDCGVYLRVGPEIGVASTKAFTAQVAVLTMLAIELGRRKHVGPAQTAAYLKELQAVPGKIASVLNMAEHIKQIAIEYSAENNWLFMGRGLNYPVALEGALKLKEISYIHAEGLPAAEMKHGPIALISKGTPAVFVATRGSQYEKIIGNIEEVRARGGKTIVVATQGDDEIKRCADHVIYVPDTIEEMQPMVNIVPLQILAYYAAVHRGYDVDKPRNLAKSVTVE
ncbi:Glutamine--fructose-6-phosphate aminotransferase, isomerizing [Limihaloglobus sulfuriphilus]|uniref:Glutamine--fructose-6-phosphate aminotransferase [isomerizing] n=1 Tax=Limihaloglobus sulfuriphilus TaxID=1851148 RepID=A0A1Q2MG82_9BACT|nr:glutamine--fructose-6-phosphate transaminase (isomerizing) [Limihaloglobus sulfuriphilus]AQQ71282.1 Glutamine--fructose-6-phosphate aminotransferase, isomerizing [Limihaloglobus sulfuriphilus]